jgi:hypothetical protein
MNTDKTFIFRSDDKGSANTSSAPSTLSEREKEFQSALESYLSDYRLEMGTYTGREVKVRSYDRRRLAERFGHHLGRFLSLFTPSTRPQRNSQPSTRQSW